MNHTTDTNERVFYLTESEIGEIVSESTVTVIEEGVGSWLGKLARKGVKKGIAKLAKSNFGKNVLSKTKKIADDVIDQTRLKQNWPKPIYANKLTGPLPKQVADFLGHYSPNTSKNISNAYTLIYENPQLWDVQIPNYNMTCRQFENSVAELIYKIRKENVADMIAKLERGEVDNIMPPEMRVKYQKAVEYCKKLKLLTKIAASILVIAGVVIGEVRVEKRRRERKEREMQKKRELERKQKTEMIRNLQKQ